MGATNRRLNIWVRGRKETLSVSGIIMPAISLGLCLIYMQALEETSSVSTILHRELDLSNMKELAQSHMASKCRAGIKTLSLGCRGPTALLFFSYRDQTDKLCQRIMVLLTLRVTPEHRPTAALLLHASSAACEVDCMIISFGEIEALIREVQ